MNMNIQMGLGVVLESDEWQCFRGPVDMGWILGIGILVQVVHVRRIVPR